MSVRARTVLAPLPVPPREYSRVYMDEFIKTLGYTLDRLNEAIARAPMVMTGVGDPEGVVVANPNTLYVNTAAASGSGLFFKETGLSSSGWVMLTAIPLGPRKFIPTTGGMALSGLAPTLVVA